MRRAIGGFLLLGSLLLAACDESPPEATGPGPRADAPGADLLGRWEVDVEELVVQNRETVLRQAREVVEGIRAEDARIEALPEAERTEARRAFDAKVAKGPPETRELVDAVLAEGDALERWAGKKLAERFPADAVLLEFRTGGTCSAHLGILGMPAQDAEGTWTRSGEDVTVRMTTVNGKPAKGKDLRAVPMTVTPGRLRFQPVPDGPWIAMRPRQG